MCSPCPDLHSDCDNMYCCGPSSRLGKGGWMAVSVIFGWAHVLLDRASLDGAFGAVRSGRGPGSSGMRASMCSLQR